MFKEFIIIFSMSLMFAFLVVIVKEDFIKLFSSITDEITSNTKTTREYLFYVVLSMTIGYLISYKLI